MTTTTVVSSRFEVGAVCRPLFPGDLNGDAWAGIAQDDRLMIVIADGVGHGREANHASSRAISTVQGMLQADPDAPLREIMQTCHQSLRGSRGAALALCRFDAGRALVSYCGVGNTRFLRHPQRKGLGVSLPGTVGCIMRSVRVFDTDLAPGDVFAFHSDGVSGSLALEGYASLDVQAAAERGMDDHGKIIDDATLIVVRYPPPERAALVASNGSPLWQR